MRRSRSCLRNRCRGSAVAAGLALPVRHPRLTTGPTTDRRQGRTALEVVSCRLRNPRPRRDTGGEPPMSARTELTEDWVDLSGPPAGPLTVAAERIPQPLWYFPPRDEWPGRLWR